MYGGVVPFREELIPGAQRHYSIVTILVMARKKDASQLDKTPVKLSLVRKTRRQEDCPLSLLCWQGFYQGTYSLIHSRES